MDERLVAESLGSADLDAEQKERTIMDAVSSLVEERDFKRILSLVVNMQSLWSDVTTVRITKIVKKILKALPSDKAQEVLGLVSELIAWADKENKKILKLDLECKRINALLNIGRHTECLESTRRVMKDLKRFDDKENQIRLYICESRAFYDLQDIAKSRSSLTSARILAVSAYCPYELQAQIDLLCGMLICEEKQYSTAYSYFVEAIDSFKLAKEPEGALLTGRYLLLSKIIDKRWQDISNLMKSKIFIPFLNDAFIQLLLKVEVSCRNRDLRAYHMLLDENKDIINTDKFIKSHLYFLYGVLFESNILKIIEPYSNIKISTISDALGFSRHDVEDTIRKMILERKINGTIDNVNGCIFLFDRRDTEESLDLCQPFMLDKARILRFVQKAMDERGFLYHCTEYMRLSTMYWSASILGMLGLTDELHKTKAPFLDFLAQCRNRDGGYGMSRGFPSTILATFNALQILHIFSEMAYDEHTEDYILGLFSHQGFFYGDAYREEDTRFVCCAVLSLKLLSIAKENAQCSGERQHLAECISETYIAHIASKGFSKNRVIEYILRCYNFDGGFGSAPDNESHTAQIFCCLGTLRALGALDSFDQCKTTQFLIFRQNSSGGFGGRPDKKEDVCYSFWNVASLSMLEGVHFANTERLWDFVMSCQDTSGGFSDRPGNEPDIYHTMFALAGLSLTGFPGIRAVDAGFCL
ncbi:UNVERIFIED_CONTAM: hypothetical protein PYX00_011898 [Menopon gallinae]|uniref:protein geranylgeranyltransferase type II n=1 Tax=Menopon gallinae TaxID=328185 RepID=A0AAW2H8Z4_9NEOP